MNDSYGYVTWLHLPVRLENNCQHIGVVPERVGRLTTMTDELSSGPLYCTVQGLL